MDWLKGEMLLILKNKILKKGSKTLIKRYLITSKYTETQNVNRSTKTNVNVIKAEASKNLVTKH